MTVFETEALDDCTEYMTDDAIELLFGSVEECQRIQLNPPPEGFTKKVKVTHIEGIEGVTASVDASLEGGIGDGQKVTYTLVYEDGGWKIDAVTTRPDRSEAGPGNARPGRAAQLPESTPALRLNPWN